MSRELIVTSYEKLEALLQKLPGGLQKPILKELGPIKEIFLQDRPARLALIGSPEGAPSAERLLQLLCAQNDEIAAQRFEPGPVDNGWRTWTMSHIGSVQVLDLRGLGTESLAGALSRFAPDAILLWDSAKVEATQPTWPGTLADLQAHDALTGPLLVFSEGDENRRDELRAILHANRQLTSTVVRTLAANPAGFAAGAEALCDLLPNEARLQFARLCGSRAGRERVASTLLKSFSGITGIIGMQPIPLADMPVLTGIQSAMVLMIASASGRKVSARTVAEFVSAVGINLGVAFLFREGARNLVKFVPIWGNAVSGFVAGAGTYAIGKAAIAYFIHEAPQREIRRLLRRSKSTPPPLPPST